MTAANDKEGGVALASIKLRLLDHDAVAEAIEAVSFLTDAELGELENRQFGDDGCRDLAEEAIRIERLFRRERPDLDGDAA